MAIEVPDAPFEAQTEEVIRQRMFDAMDSDLDQSEGSMAWNLISPIAIELEQIWQSLDQAVDLGFVQTAYGAFLDARAEEYGLFRKEAEQATVTVTFSGSDGTVPKGTRVGNTVAFGSTEDPVVFVLDEDAVISGGSSPATSATAESAGKAGNVAVGAIDRMIDFVSIVTSLTNTVVGSGGTDEETDDQFRSRILGFTKEWRGAGSANDYKAWAMEAAEVVWKVDVLPGTVPALDIYLFDVDFNPVGASVRQTVEDYVAQHRPLGADVTVNDGATDPVAVAVVATYVAGYTSSELREAAEAVVQEYIDSLETDQVVRQSKIEGAVASLTGVESITSSTIDAVNSDYTPTSETLMRMSSFSLS